MLDIGPGGAVACSAMPQTELLIHIVLDTETVSPAAQTEIHSAALDAAVASLGEAVTIHRSGIEVRPLADPPPVAAAPADATQASAPAPVEADPAIGLADPVPAAPQPGHADPPQAAPHRPTT